MSADNEVAILRTKRGEDWEYRVKEIQAADNLYWDDEAPNPHGGKGWTGAKINMEVARDYFSHVLPYTTLQRAMDEAISTMTKIVDSGGYVEYGIRLYETDEEF